MSTPKLHQSTAYNNNKTNLKTLQISNQPQKDDTTALLKLLQIQFLQYYLTKVVYHFQQFIRNSSGDVSRMQTAQNLNKTCEKVVPLS